MKESKRENAVSFSLSAFILVPVSCSTCLHAVFISFCPSINRCVAEIQIFEKTYLIVIKNETGLKFKINVSTLFLIGSYAQKLVASY